MNEQSTIPCQHLKKKRNRIRHQKGISKETQKERFLSSPSPLPCCALIVRHHFNSFLFLFLLLHLLPLTLTFFLWIYRISQFVLLLSRIESSGAAESRGIEKEEEEEKEIALKRFGEVENCATQLWDRLTDDDRRRRCWWWPSSSAAEAAEASLELGLGGGGGSLCTTGGGGGGGGGGGATGIRKWGITRANKTLISAVLFFFCACVRVGDDVRSFFCISISIDETKWCGILLLLKSPPFHVLLYFDTRLSSLSLSCVQQYKDFPLSHRSLTIIAIPNRRAEPTSRECP